MNFLVEMFFVIPGFIGDARVGKTSLIRQAKLQAQRTGNLFQPENKSSQPSVVSAKKHEENEKINNENKMFNHKPETNKNNNLMTNSSGSDVDDSALESTSTPSLSPSNSTVTKNSNSGLKANRSSLNNNNNCGSVADEGIQSAQK